MHGCAASSTTCFVRRFPRWPASSSPAPTTASVSDVSRACSNVKIGPFSANTLLLGQVCRIRCTDKHSSVIRRYYTCNQLSECFKSIFLP